VVALVTSAVLAPMTPGQADRALRSAMTHIEASRVRAWPSR